jgi:hypothetical protein
LVVVLGVVLDGSEGGFAMVCGSWEGFCPEWEGCRFSCSLVFGVILAALFWVLLCELFLVVMCLVS